MLTQRDAITVLHEPTRPGLTRRLARDVLVAGFAGIPVKVGGACAYDARTVRELAHRPDARDRPLPFECRDGLLVIRTAARPGVALLPEDRRLDPPPGPFRMSPWAMVQLDVIRRRHGFVPVVVTVASYVLVAAELTGLRSGEQDAGPRGRMVHLALRSAGGWAEAFAGARLPTSSGSPWLLWTPYLQPFAMA